MCGAAREAQWTTLRDRIAHPPLRACLTEAHGLDPAMRPAVETLLVALRGRARTWTARRAAASRATRRGTSTSREGGGGAGLRCANGIEFRALCSAQRRKIPNSKYTLVKPAKAARAVGASSKSHSRALEARYYASSWL